MHAILAITKKDLRYLVRDKTGFFFVFAFPLIFAVFFGLIFSGMGGGASGIRTAIVDLDRSEGSRAFIESLKESDGLDLRVYAEPDEQGTQPIDRARNAVRNGSVTAMIALQPGFGAAQDNMFQGRTATITLGVDPSRSAEAGMIEGIVAEKAYANLTSMFTDTDRMREQSRAALEDLRQNASPAVQTVMIPFLSSFDTFASGLDTLEEEGEESGGAGGFRPVTIEHADILKDAGHEVSAFELSFPQGLIWGLMSAAFTFGLSFVIERTRGTLLRLRIAPIPTRSVLLGKSLACFILIVGLSTAMLAFGALVFGVRPDSVAHLAMAIVSMGVCWVGLMMLIAVSGKTEAAVGGIGWAILMLMAMIGGGMIPRPFMPSWMETVGVTSPVRWSLQSLEGALWRDYSTPEMLIPCAVLFGIGLLGFVVGARLFDWSTSE